MKIPYGAVYQLMLNDTLEMWFHENTRGIIRYCLF